MKIKSKTIKIILLIVGVILLGVAVYFSVSTILSALAFLGSLFFPFILGYIFSALTKPVAELLQRRLKFPRNVAAITVIILIFGILGSLLGFAVWKIVSEFRNLYEQLPYIISNAQEWAGNFYQKISGLYDAMPPNIKDAIEATGDNISNQIATFINTRSTPMMWQAGDIAKRVPGIFIGIIVFLLSSYFMISDDGKVSDFVHKLIPKRHLDMIYRIRHEIKKYLGGYIKAQAILMCIAFVILMISLSILRIRFALIIALGIAFFDALPFFGSGAVLWPWAIISFLNGDFRCGIGLVITYVAIVLMRQFIEPKLVSSKIGMHPILTLMSMYVGYRVLSIGGMILGPVILMLVMSLYRAGVFDGIISFIKKCVRYIKQQAMGLKDYIKDIVQIK